jgi:Bacterial EndoU nuclease
VEPRTRAECYEALRAADGRSSQIDAGSSQTGKNHGQADGGSGPTGENHGRPDGVSDQAEENHGRADSGTQAEPRTDTGTERSGWDAVDVEHAKDRPAPDAIRVTPERATHILDGDPVGDGGGHRHGTGKPGKTEFPADWDDEKVVDKSLSVARKPDRPPVHQDRNNRWLCTGTRDSVEMSVIVLPSGEVWTAWPEEGSPGVVRNPRKGKS